MASPRPRPADIEFDPPPGAWPPESDLRAIRRVVVNPFLAVLGLVAWGGTLPRLLASPMPPLAVLTTALLLGLPYLVHFHCLDCGRTGMLPRCSRHACPGLVARWRKGSHSGWGWPRPGTQMVVWIWVIASLTLLIAVSRAGLGPA